MGVGLTRAFARERRVSPSSCFPLARAARPTSWGRRSARHQPRKHGQSAVAVSAGPPVGCRLSAPSRLSGVTVPFGFSAVQGAGGGAGDPGRLGCCAESPGEQRWDRGGRPGPTGPGSPRTHHVALTRTHLSSRSCTRSAVRAAAGPHATLGPWQGWRRWPGRKQRDQQQRRRCRWPGRARRGTCTPHVFYLK